MNTNQHTVSSLLARESLLTASNADLAGQVAWLTERANVAEADSKKNKQWADHFSKELNDLRALATRLAVSGNDLFPFAKRNLMELRATSHVAALEATNIMDDAQNALDNARKAGLLK